MYKKESFTRYDTCRVDVFSFDLMHMDMGTINQIIESFAILSPKITDMHFGNHEEHTDHYSMRFRDIYDYRTSGTEGDYDIDHFSFYWEMNGHRFAVSMDLTTFELCITYNKNISANFLPFLINVENSIRSGKNRSGECCVPLTEGGT